MPQYRPLLSLVILSLTSAWLAGCTTTNWQTAHQTNEPLDTLYDFQIIDSGNQRPLTIEQAAQQLASADVVVIGEFHSHNGAHLLQSWLQQALYDLRPQQILTMEQFTIEHQAALDRYLSGQSGEQAMMEDADAWDNYQAAYRPLVEFAIANGLPVVATNAPADIIHCLGRLGPDYLETLPPERRAALPQQPFLDTPDYQDKFITAMTGGHHGGGDPTRLMNSYRAQLLRDNTMASRILLAHQQNPGAQILHLTGTFHSEGHLGTVAALQQRAPELTIKVVSPVFTESDGRQPALEDQLDKGDLLYLIRPLPVEYRDPQRQLEHLQEQFGNSDPPDCTG